MIRPFCLVLLFLLACAAQAGPGAHGPNGEHLDAPATSAAMAAAQPVVEASTEAFELVGTLSADELSVLVDRYETNEPVLNGTLEVEFGGLKAAGTLHADIGDYAFTDEKLLKALRQPGNHALVFTLVAGNDADLIEGTLNVASDQDAHGDSGWTRSWWLWGAAAVALAIAGTALLRRRHAGKKA
ncbi:hypothetical protein [Cupriavidus oxalaticus]|uniref:hypothetical protein n=1 Tax=Cupriavidus oxalaticus TaxID=96344 RepID=UPI00317D3ABB